MVVQAQNDPIGSFFNSVDTFLGNVFVNIVAVVLVSSQAASLIAIQGNGSRYLFALGRDRVLLPRLTAVHSRLQSPYVAVLAVGLFSLISLVVIVTSGIDPVHAYGTLTGAGIYFLLPLLIATSIAVVVCFRRNKDLSPGVWVAVVAPVISAIALIVPFVLTTQNLTILTVTSTRALVAEIALALVAASGFLLALFYKRTRREVYDSIGNQ